MTDKWYSNAWFYLIPTILLSIHLVGIDVWAIVQTSGFINALGLHFFILMLFLMHSTILYLGFVSIQLYNEFKECESKIFKTKPFNVFSQVVDLLKNEGIVFVRLNADNKKRNPLFNFITSKYPEIIKIENDIVISFYSARSVDTLISIGKITEQNKYTIKKNQDIIDSHFRKLTIFPNEYQ